MDDDLGTGQIDALHRRHFLQRAGLVGLATAWSTPIVQTVLANPAQAGSPPPGPVVNSASTPSRDSGSKDDGSKDDGSKDDGSKDDGSKDDGSKDDGSKDDGSKDD